jgi:hypothetical protein
MGDLKVAKMLLKNSAARRAEKNSQQEVKDLREAVKCVVRYLEKLEKAAKSK